MKIMKRAFLAVLSIGLLGSCTPSPTPTPSVNKYLIQFNTDRGSFIPSQLVEENNKISKPKNPTRGGYNFKYWSCNGEEFDDDDFAKPVTSDITLKAEWDEQPGPVDDNYIVSFDSDGGTYVSVQVVKKDDYAYEPLDPKKKEGNFSYTFEGWYLDGDLNPFDFDNTPITDDITLTARWTGSPTPPKVMHVVDFNTDGGSYIAAQRVTHNEAAIKPENPTKIVGGYEFTFLGWYLDDDPVPFDFDTPIINNITLTAHWEGTLPHLVTFNSNGGTYIEPDFVVDGEKVKEPTDPTREGGYTFDGWYDNESLSGDRYDFDTPVTDDFTLYAKWISPIVKYTITFIMNGATSDPIDPIEVNEGEKASEPPAPTKDGYSFQGWCEDEALLIPFTFEDTAINKNYILYANWGQQKEYSVDFYDGNIKYDDLHQTINYGNKVQRPDNPTKEDETFSGWYQEPTLENLYNFDNKITDLDISEIKIYAKWTHTQFAVAFASNGGSIVQPLIVNSGETIERAPSTDYAGHTFGGWYTDDGTFENKFKFGPSGVGDPITSSIVLYAKWTIISYVVTIDYNYEGSTPKKINVNYNEVIPAPQTPERQGYDFNGWYDAAEGGNVYDFSKRITENKTIFAHWTRSECTLFFDANGGTVDIDHLIVDKGTKYADIKNIPTPNRDNYKFLGWSLKKDTPGILPTTILNKEYYLYAHWMPLQKFAYFMKEEDGEYFVCDSALILSGYIQDAPLHKDILTVLEKKDGYNLLGFATSEERAKEGEIDLEAFDGFYEKVTFSYEGDIVELYPVYELREHTLHLMQHDKDFYTPFDTNGLYDITINGEFFEWHHSIVYTFSENEPLVMHFKIHHHTSYDHVIIPDNQDVIRKMFQIICYDGSITGLEFDKQFGNLEEITITIGRATNDIYFDSYLYVVDPVETYN